MARFKLFLAQGCERSDIDDLLEHHDAQVIEDYTDHLVVEVDNESDAAFSDDAENDFNVSCVDLIK